MVKSCVVAGCSSSSRNSKWSFHRFPPKAEERTLWMRNVGLPDDFELKEHHRVCSLHFVSGEPTKEQPHPTIGTRPPNQWQLGERLKVLEEKRKEEVVKKWKRIFDSPRPARRTRIDNDDDDDDNDGNADKENRLDVDAATSAAADATNNATSNAMDTPGREAGRLSLSTVTPSPDLMKFVRLSYQHLRSSDRFVSQFTGFRSDGELSGFLGVLADLKAHGNFRYWGTDIARRSSRRTTPRLLTMADELLLTLLRLRLGLLLVDLAFRFGISDTYCSNIFITYVCGMHQLFKAIDWWPSKEKIVSTTPSHFYHKNVAVIVDCTEIFIERPSSPYLQAATWSSYKHHNTVKILLGIMPRGVITFCSRAYGGRASDNQITIDCGILDRLKPGDILMSDKGFDLKDRLPAEVTVLMPPPLEKRPQFSAAEVTFGRRVASQRIHIERAIRSFKKYRIFKNNLPINNLVLVDKIIYVCAMLVNFQSVLVRDKTDLGQSDSEFDSDSD